MQDMKVDQSPQTLEPAKTLSTMAFDERATIVFAHLTTFCFSMVLGNQIRAILGPPNATELHYREVLAFHIKNKVLGLKTHHQRRICLQFFAMLVLAQRKWD